MSKSYDQPPSDELAPSDLPAGDPELASAVDALLVVRDAILSHWLEATSRQPFHQGRRGRAVADDIPRLFDALLALLRKDGVHRANPDEPLDDPEVLAAAQDHARARAAQGLRPAEVVIEFRLLRREIWRVLHLANTIPTGSVLSLQYLINDALDAAITLGSSALTAQVEEVREDFMATTPHEVRQPITAIKGSAQFAERLLSRPEPDLQRIRQTLQRIETESDHLAAVLSRQVEASRIALGYLDLRPTPADLVSLVRETVAQFEPERAARVRLVFPPDTDASGWWDPIRLDQVIRNLLSNAFKYSPPEAPVEIAIQAEPDTMHLHLRDHGFGIAPEDLPHLFHRYFRCKAAVERGVEGSGLGLYLCRGIIEAHHGRIWAESPGPGQGTTIHITLPRKTAAVSPHP